MEFADAVFCIVRARAADMGEDLARTLVAILMAEGHALDMHIAGAEGLPLPAPPNAKDIVLWETTDGRTFLRAGHPLAAEPSPRSLRRRVFGLRLDGADRALVDAQVEVLLRDLGRRYREADGAIEGYLMRREQRRGEEPLAPPGRADEDDESADAAERSQAPPPRHSPAEARYQRLKPRLQKMRGLGYSVRRMSAELTADKFQDVSARSISRMLERLDAETTRQSIAS